VEIVIVGAGRHGSEVYSYLTDIAAIHQDVRVVGFVDDKKPGGRWLSTEILGSFADLAACWGEHTTYHYITATGSNDLRRAFVQKAESINALRAKAWSVIHPQAVIGRDVTIGAGTCVAPGAIITTRVRIGCHCIVNVNASVSHDCVIGDFVNINPGAVIAGSARIGDGVFVGAGATVIDEVVIGHGTVIGAGAVVIDDIPPCVTAVGVPARPLSHRNG
jgi:sugar O-acyltransferase (sialic acid O-acetyltransferase NeuD family)